MKENALGAGESLQLPQHPYHILAPSKLGFSGGICGGGSIQSSIAKGQNSVFNRPFRVSNFLPRSRRFDRKYQTRKPNGI